MTVRFGDTNDSGMSRGGTPTPSRGHEGSARGSHPSSRGSSRSPASPHRSPASPHHGPSRSSSPNVSSGVAARGVKDTVAKKFSAYSNPRAKASTRRKAVIDRLKTPESSPDVSPRPSESYKSPGDAESSQHVSPRHSGSYKSPSYAESGPQVSVYLSESYISPSYAESSPPMSPSYGRPPSSRRRQKVAMLFAGATDQQSQPSHDEFPPQSPASDVESLSSISLTRTKSPSHVPPRHEHDRADSLPPPESESESESEARYVSGGSVHVGEGEPTIAGVGNTTLTYDSAAGTDIDSELKKDVYDAPKTWSKSFGKSKKTLSKDDASSYFSGSVGESPAVGKFYSKGGDLSKRNLFKGLDDFAGSTKTLHMGPPLKEDEEYMGGDYMGVKYMDDQSDDCFVTITREDRKNRLDEN